MMAVTAVANIVGSVSGADVHSWPPDERLPALVVGRARSGAGKRVISHRAATPPHGRQRSQIRSVTGKLLRFAAIALWGVHITDSGSWSRSGCWQAVQVQDLGQELQRFAAGHRPGPGGGVLVFKLSKLVHFVLETDVMPRSAAAQRTSRSQDRPLHHPVIGFSVGSECQLDFSKPDHRQRAVGIGFGLQNVVNNFISGLILLFERPIKEGDRIDLGTTSGVVRKIGMRASVVETWQGADVIVPNATLISSELVNWTLKDEVRRIDIPVGVYGTDQAGPRPAV
jgi:hypothetical protein